MASFTETIQNTPQGIRAIHKGKEEVATIIWAGEDLYVVNYDNGEEAEVRESTIKRWWKVYEQKEVEEENLPELFVDEKTELKVTGIQFYMVKGNPKRRVTFLFKNGTVMDTYDYATGNAGAVLYKDETRQEVLAGNQWTSQKKLGLDTEEVKAVRRLRAKLNKIYPREAWEGYVDKGNAYWKEPEEYTRKEEETQDSE